MFELVNSLRSELIGTPLRPVVSHEREAVVKEVIAKLYDSAVPRHLANPNVSYNGQFQLELSIAGAFDITHFAAGRSQSDPTLMNNNHLRIPPLLLIDSEEIPENFRVTDIDDPRLNDRDHMQSYADWLHDELGLPRTSYDPLTFKSNLQFLQDSQKAKEALKFVILHELGHMHNNDIDDMNYDLKNWSPVISISLFLCVALALCISFPLTIPVAAFCATLTTGTALLGYCALNAITLIFLRRIEQRADIFAAENCPETIDGGIYFLKVCEQMEKLVRQRDMEQTSFPLLKWAMNFLHPVQEFFSNDHPSSSKRIAVLESMKQQRQPIIPLTRAIRA